MAGVSESKNVTVGREQLPAPPDLRRHNRRTSSELFTTDACRTSSPAAATGRHRPATTRTSCSGCSRGPAAGIGADGTNEIDIEYSRWGQASGPNGDWTDYPASGTTIGELQLLLHARAGSSSRRLASSWSATSIADIFWSGLNRSTNDQGSSGGRTRRQVDGQRSPAGASAGDESPGASQTRLGSSPVLHSSSSSSRPAARAVAGAGGRGRSQGERARPAGTWCWPVNAGT